MGADGEGLLDVGGLARAGEERDVPGRVGGEGRQRLLHKGDHRGGGDDRHVDVRDQAREKRFPSRAGLDDRTRFGDRGLRRAKTGGDRSASPADLSPRREVERPERDQRLRDLPRRRVVFREEKGGHSLRAQHFPKVGQRPLRRAAEEEPAGGGERFREQRDPVAFLRDRRSPGKRFPGRGAVTLARRGKAAEQRLPLVHRVSPPAPRRIFHRLRNGCAAGAGKSRRSVHPEKGYGNPVIPFPFVKNPPSTPAIRSIASSSPARFITPAYPFIAAISPGVFKPWSRASDRSSSRKSGRGIFTGQTSAHAPHRVLASGSAAASGRPTSSGVRTAPIGPE